MRRSVRTILNRSYILEHLIEAGKVAIIGGKHDLATGQVTFYEDTWVHDEASIRAVTGRLPLKAVITAPAAEVPRAKGAPADVAVANSAASAAQ